MTAIASRNFGVRRSFIVLTAALYLAGFPFYAASASTIPPLQLTCKYEWEDYDDRTTFGVVDLSFLTGSGQQRVTARFDGKDEEQAAIRLIEANRLSAISRG